MRAAAVALSFNQWTLSERCLESLLKNSRSIQTLYWVDNASTDGTATRLASYPSRFQSAGIQLEIVRLQTNLGFGKGMNVGIERALKANPRFEAIALLNNDTYFPKAWDQELLQQLSELAETAALAPMTDETPWTGTTDEMERRLERLAQRNRARSRAELSLIALFVRRSVFESVGLFDPRFFVTYEDTDLRERMQRAGLGFRQTGRVVIWHHSKGSRGHDSTLDRQGLQLFTEKWGFDPRVPEHTPLNKLRKTLRKVQRRFGFL